MFGKYIWQNFKKNLVGYILIFLLETSLICVSLVASGIAFDAMTDRDYIQTGAKEINFDFEKTSAGELREKLDKFINGLPAPYAEIMVGLSKAEEYEKFSGSYVVWQYPDYETMCRQLTEGVWKLDMSEIPTREQFENNEMAAIVGNNAGDAVDISDGHFKIIQYQYNFTDDDHIMIAGQEYLVTGRFQSHGVHVLFSAIPDDTLMKGVTIEMKSYPNQKVIDEIYNLAVECFVGVRYWREPQINELLGWRNSASNIMLSTLIIFMSVFNILLVFKYLLSSRQRYFAVLRFCGFKKSTCVVYGLAELLFLSIISSAASFFAFHFGLSPIFAEHYSSFDDVVFSPGYYIMLYGIFLAANILLFAVYIAPSLSRSVRENLSEV